jgi:acyl-CoA thioester hydrolase
MPQFRARRERIDAPRDPACQSGRAPQRPVPERQAARRIFSCGCRILRRAARAARAAEEGSMPKEPIVYKTTHRIKFSDLDPYNHVSTGRYATYYVDHRMEGLREHVGWDLQTLGTLPFMTWVRRMEIDFVRPARGDQEIAISSFVREIRGPDAIIECTMVDSGGKTVSRCVMTVAHVEKATNRASDWPADLAALFFEP